MMDAPYEGKTVEQWLMDLSWGSVSGNGKEGDLAEGAMAS
jgi:hypothetical protein